MKFETFPCGLIISESLTVNHFTNCLCLPPLPRATVVCVVLCFLIFFDDYSAVLIPGNSLRSVSLGPTPSFCSVMHDR